MADTYHADGTARPSGPVGLGGWLILPIFGLLATLGLTGFNLFQMFQEFDAQTLDLLLNADSPPITTLRTGIIISALGGTAILITAIIGLTLIFAKSRFAPRAMIVHYAFLLLAAGGEFYAVQLFESAGLSDETLTTDAVRGLARAVGGVIVWIPYFIVSKRVKNTFVR